MERLGGSMGSSTDENTPESQSEERPTLSRKTVKS
jgi:hypothetical protein